jgi:hypothetical protein
LVGLLGIEASVAGAHSGLTASGVIHGCVNVSLGDLRLVGPSASCKNNEAPVDWNAEGQPGPMGPSGISGYEMLQFCT